jgi:hypothetical protein
VQSGGKPVRGASVLAAAEGAYAETDSSGLFCLLDLEAEVQRLQIFALGFAPVERYLPSRPETLVVELVPLRTLSSGGPLLVSREPPPDGRAKPRRDIVTELPEYLARDDSLRFARPPSGEFERSLQRFHALLSTRALADSVTRARGWAGVARSLQATAVPKEGADPAVADYVRQAEAVAWARAAVLENDREAAERARRALARRRSRNDPGYDAWRARIEALLPH